jgi:hypothetical protein
MRQLTLWLAITVATVIAASLGTVSQVMASANSFTVVPLLGGALIPTPTPTAPHNWAKLLITEMVIADDFDEAPGDWGEFCIFITGEGGRRLARIFDCTRAFRDGCRSGGRRVPCSYRITPADGGEVFLQSPTGQATVTLNLRERDSGWDTDAECLQDVILDFSQAYDGEVNCPGRNKIKYRVEPVEAAPAEQMWFVLSDVTIHTSFEGPLSPDDDGEFCVFVEAGGRPLTSAYDCTQTLEAGFEHPLNSGEGYAPVPAGSSRATIHLRERDSGWDENADCVASVSVVPGPGEVGCPGKNVVRYAVGRDLNQLLSSRLTRRVVDRRQPRIVSFERTPADGIIERGGSAELQWRVECAVGCAVSLVGVGTNLQNQPLIGSTTVSPQQSTTYTLTADNQGFTHKKTVGVWIRPEPAAARTPFYFKVFCEGSLGATGSCERCFSSECRTYTVFASTRDAALAEVRAQNSNCRIDEIQGGDEPTTCDAFKRDCDHLCGF